MSNSVERRVKVTLRQLLAGVVLSAFLFAFVRSAFRMNAWWWVQEAISLGLHFYPQLTWAAKASAFAIIIAFAFDRRVWRFRSLWMLSPVAVPILLLTFGVVFEGAARSAPPTALPLLVVEWFPWLLFPLGLILLVGFRSIAGWIITFGISIVALWLSVGAREQSYMSVSNNWL